MAADKDEVTLNRGEIITVSSPSDDDVVMATVAMDKGPDRRIGFKRHEWDSLNWNIGDEIEFLARKVTE